MIPIVIDFTGTVPEGFLRGWKSYKSEDSGENTPTKACEKKTLLNKSKIPNLKSFAVLSIYLSIYIYIYIYINE